MSMTLEVPDEIHRALRVLDPERQITGTLGVLLKAKRHGEIPSLKFEIDRLVQDADFFASNLPISRTPHLTKSPFLQQLHDSPRHESRIRR